MNNTIYLALLSIASLTSCESTCSQYEYEYEYEFALHNATGLPLNIDWTVNGSVYHTIVMHGPSSEMNASYYYLSHTQLTTEQLNDLYDCVAYDDDSLYVSSSEVGDLRYYSYRSERDISRPQQAANCVQYHYTLE
jgi:hypothetical protein